MDQAFAIDLGVALLAGLLIGLERQMTGPRLAGGQVDIGGIRTFPLFALVGALTGSLAASQGAWLPAVGLGAVAALLASLHLPGAAPRPSTENGEGTVPENGRGLTTEVAALATYLLGVVSGTPGLFASWQEQVAGVFGPAVVVALVLSLRSRLHALTGRLHPEELLGALQLLLIGVVLLPIVPDVGYGPGEAVRPREVGLMVLFIGGVGFLGFVTSRLWGAGRGLVVAGLLGGLASSTAVAYTMARRGREAPALVGSASVAIVGASVVMLLRVLAAATIVAPALGPRLAGTLLAMVAAGAIAGAPTLHEARVEEAAAADLEVTNPFELRSALVFGVAYAGVKLLATVGHAAFGAVALYVTALLAGLTDVDAVTLSTAQLAREGLPLPVAAGVVLTACLANTVVKLGIAWVNGGPAVGRRVARPFAAMFVVGAALVVVHALG